MKVTETVIAYSPVSSGMYVNTVGIAASAAIAIDDWWSVSEGGGTIAAPILAWLLLGAIYLRSRVTVT